MGLFSKLFKNKQESSGEDSGFYVPGEAQAPNRKRAANTSGGGGSRRGGKEAPDPALPEKKRARRRLIGAVALALGVAIGLPMLLDSESKAPVNDIASEIPSKDKPAAAPAPRPAQPAQASASAGNDQGLDESEELVDTPAPAKVTPAAPTPAPVLAAAAPAPAPAKPEYLEPRMEAKPEPKPEPKPVKVEAKPEPKPEPKHEKPEAKPETKPEPKVEKPAKPAQSSDDAARALAILEGKPVSQAAKPQDKPHDTAGGKFVVQVAALATQDKVNELQDKLRDAGISSYTQKVSSASGERIRVRVGPSGSREEAEKTLAKVQKLGLGGSVVAQ